MKTANTGEFKNNLGKFIRFVEQSEVIEIRKRNIPIAKVTTSFSQPLQVRPQQ
jgi:antitoxin (DNA-binding transcriptional repressor) of toxin-antitoxin stability system